MQEVDFNFTNIGAALNGAVVLKRGYDNFNLLYYINEV